MTPLEERIDHEEAKRIAERHLATLHIHSPDCPTCSLARAYLALLTEHSAREEASEQRSASFDHGYRVGQESMLARIRGLEERLRETESWLYENWKKNAPSENHERWYFDALLERRLSELLPATEPAQPEEER